MLIAGNCSLSVTEYRNGAIHTDCHKDRLAMVLAELNSGALGDGCHGNEAHITALKQVVARAAEIITKIENPPPRTCNRHNDCDAADVKARAAGHTNASHCHDDCCEDCFGN